MTLHRPACAALLFTVVQGAFAAPSEVTLSHLTVGNFRDQAQAGLDKVNILSDNGRFAVLGLEWAEGTALQQTTNQYVSGWYGITADFTPAEGYAVKSMTLGGFLDVERVNPPAEYQENDFWLGYSLYILGPGFGGGWSYNSAPSEDSLLSETVALTDREYIDSSKPFYAELVTAADINGYRQANDPAPFASIAWRNITLQIEMVPVAAIPEPGTWMMLLAGLAGIGFAARRRSA